MPSPFLSSEEYDERAHQLYNEGQYDEALDVLRDGLALYPNSVELHIGVGYARLAREEYAWARQSFEKAVVLDPDHEDALAGLGETLLKFGQQEQAVAVFRRVLELGYSDDIDLMLQVGRALFRENLFDDAKNFFDVAVQEAPDLAEAAACLGYAHHQLGNEEAALTELRRALELDEEHSEARIYYANMLYDRQEYESALTQLDRTTPEDHWGELGIWRLIEMKKTLYRLDDDDPELKPWEERLAELAGEPDDIDDMLGEIEERAAREVMEAEQAAKGQLELFGALLADLTERQAQSTIPEHVVEIDGREFVGAWEDIVREMRDADLAFRGRSLEEFMVTEARRGASLKGVRIPSHDPESFLRGSASAGLLRIVR